MLGDTVLRSRKTLNKFSSNKMLMSWGTTDTPAFSYCLQSDSKCAGRGCPLFPTTIVGFLFIDFTFHGQDVNFHLSILYMFLCDRSPFLEPWFMLDVYCVHYLVIYQIKKLQYSCMWWFQVSGGGGRKIEGRPWLQGEVEASHSCSSDITPTQIKHKQLNRNNNVTTIWKDFGLI